MNMQLLQDGSQSSPAALKAASHNDFKTPIYQEYVSIYFLYLLVWNACSKTMIK